jgi:hypothetical protein
MPIGETVSSDLLSPVAAEPHRDRDSVVVSHVPGEVPEQHVADQGRRQCCSDDPFRDAEEADVPPGASLLARYSVAYRGIPCHDRSIPGNRRLGSIHM